MGIFKKSGRKNTGRTDKYSDENPRKDYADYRKDYPKSNETTRKEAEEITKKLEKEKFIGKKSLKVRKQELIAHIQNYQETFNSVEDNNWRQKFGDLSDNLTQK